MKRLSMLWLAAVLCLAATGCAATGGIEISGGVNKVPSVRIDDISLSGDYEVREQACLIRSAGGFMEVSVSIRNLRGSTGKIMYKFDWFEDNGMPVAPDSSIWLPKILQPGAEDSLKKTAPDRLAAAYKLRVMRLK